MGIDSLVSVIIPAYNAENTIGGLLRKLLNEVEGNFEIIVINDGSRDQTGKILNSINDKRLHCFTTENHGASAARNYGLTKASGVYVMFIDADDNVNPRIITTLQTIIHNEQADFALCGVSMNGILLKPFKSTSGRKLRKTVVLSVLTSGLIYGPWGRLYKREKILKHKIRFFEDVHYGEDLIFNLNYLKHADTIVSTPEALYFYNLSSGGLSARTTKVWAYRRAMLAALKDFTGRRFWLVRQLVALLYMQSVLRAKLRELYS